ncbi:hypothetical protein SAMN02910451_03118 [Butyrivibrio hungatei]|uniref:Uncharacterized protein n=1 Tax=Butyrivibrio hungatei TaxID=185008 RepID=A0A1G5GZX5_9FIRM|nr:DUF5975 family protein [Butyrivibrio hungatei]MEE3471808.1 DUF5975 family protein [Butyrivibrio hungatei]SCY56670.1 hypothetical protein SAMN02910451_03118 [Butyrivibrio hungatei]
MNNVELYMEFKEECVAGLLVDKNEFSRRLKKLKKGTVIECVDGKYQIYYPIDDVKKHEQDSSESLSLRIDSAARIRFEGGLVEYEELLKEINKTRAGNCDFKVFGKLREEDVDADFFIADVYYMMQ